MSWVEDTYSLAELREKADNYQWFIDLSGELPRAMDFLYAEHVIPDGVKWRRRNAVPRTSLDADAIPAGYLAEVAYEWDDDGPAPIHAFLNMLAFECLETPQNSVVNETMTDLGRR